MLDREKVLAVLKRRFPGAAAEQVAAATNAIVGLADDWIELAAATAEPDDTAPVCERSCYLAEGVRTGRFKVFRRVDEPDDED